MTPTLLRVPVLTELGILPGTAHAMIRIARSQIGYREGTNNDNAFGLWYGLNHASWCAEFVSWCAAHSGASMIVPRFAYTPSGAQWFKDRGRWAGHPQRGALAFYYHASLGRIGHVGIVRKVLPDGSWLSIEGNTNDSGSRIGNGVYLLHRTSTRGGGFGIPNYRSES